MKVVPWLRFFCDRKRGLEWEQVVAKRRVVFYLNSQLVPLEVLAEVLYFLHLLVFTNWRERARACSFSRGQGVRVWRQTTSLSPTICLFEVPFVLAILCKSVNSEGYKMTLHPKYKFLKKCFIGAQVQIYMQLKTIFDVIGLFYFSFLHFFFLA